MWLYSLCRLSADRDEMQNPARIGSKWQMKGEREGERERASKVQQRKVSAKTDFSNRSSSNKKNPLKVFLSRFRFLFFAVRSSSVLPLSLQYAVRLHKVHCSRFCTLSTFAISEQCALHALLMD